MMIKIRLITSVFLVLLLVIMSCMRDLPLAEARPGWGFTEDADIITAFTAGAEVASAFQQEPAAGTGRKMKIASREMMFGNYLINGRASKTSSGIRAGDDTSDAKKSNKYEPKRALTHGNPRREGAGEEAVVPESVHPPSIKIAAPKRTIHDVDDESASAKRERRLDSIEAADEEIFNLMRRDYSRGPPKARRKPPINNHEPSN